MKVQKTNKKIRTHFDTLCIEGELQFVLFVTDVFKFIKYTAKYSKSFAHGIVQI
jgi:hypothetical protein